MGGRLVNLLTLQSGPLLGEQSWPPGCVTLPLIALLALSVSFELVSSSARVASVKSQQSSCTQ